MTPRLKILITLFSISVLVLIADRFSTSSTSSSNINKVKLSQKIKTPLEKKNNPLGNHQSKTSPFLPISSKVTSLTGWGRNPFIKKYTKTPVQSLTITSSEKGKSVKLSQLNNLNIESYYKIGKDAVVVIDGKKYREGNKFNNMIINKIEPNKITFKFGGKNYAVDFGS